MRSRNCCFGEIEGAAHHRPDSRCAALVEQRREPLLGGVDGADLGAQIERDHVRQARIGDEGVLKFGHHLALVDDFEKIARGILVEIAGIDAEAALVDAADIGMMQDIADPQHDAAVVEQWARQHDIALVQGAEERIVGEENVAGANPTGTLHDRAQRVPDGADMDQGADAGGGDLSVLGEQSDIEVVALNHDRRGGNGADGDALLIVDLPKPMFDHLEGDRIDVRQGFSLDKPPPLPALIVAVRARSQDCRRCREQRAYPAVARLWCSRVRSPQVRESRCRERGR